MSPGGFDPHSLPPFVLNKLCILNGDGWCPMTRDACGIVMKGEYAISRGIHRYRSEIL